MLEITLTRKSCKHSEHWTAVSTILGLISSAHRDLHHWRSNQQPQYAEDETLPLGHRFMPHISDTELTSHGKVRNHLTFKIINRFIRWIKYTISCDNFKKCKYR